MEKIKAYFKEVYSELVTKTSWPTWPELQSSAIIVMVATAIISIAIFAMDFSFQHTMDFIYKMLFN